MRYLTPEFIEAYECAGEDERQRMLRTILETWDAEYQSLISCGVRPDDIWNIGAGQIDAIDGTDEADECN
jgi:hypothetical protein